MIVWPKRRFKRQACGVDIGNDTAFPCLRRRQNIEIAGYCGNLATCGMQGCFESFKTAFFAASKAVLCSKTAFSFD
jgi:hypothetical protein